MERDEREKREATRFPSWLGGINPNVRVTVMGRITRTLRNTKWYLRSTSTTYNGHHTSFTINNIMKRQNKLILLLTTLFSTCCNLLNANSTNSLVDGPMSGKHEHQQIEPKDQTCSDDQSNEDTLTKQHDIDQECSIYLAESSIPNAGFGIFTTKFLPKGSYTGAPALSIVTTDMYYHYGERDPDWAQANYNWEGNGYSTFEGLETAETVMNLGTSANYHTFLTNVDHFYLEYDDAMVDRYNDSTAGSFTYYNGHQFYANKNIEAGEELFADYGEEWLEERAETLGNVPRAHDFYVASKIMLRLFDGWKKGHLSDIECTYDEETRF